MREQEISIELFKRQIVNDVTVQCNLVGRTLRKDESMEEQAAEIMSPDDDEVKPVVARSMTESFGEVKRICQRYLILGRDTDDNRLERIDEMNRSTETVAATTAGVNGTYTLIAGMPYIIQVKCEGGATISTNTGKVILNMTGRGSVEYTPTGNEQLTITSTDNNKEVSVTYLFGQFGSYLLLLAMPESFNVGMTETIKSNAHRLMVDYVMWSVLADQYPDKAKEYFDKYTLCVASLRSSLLARTRFGRRSSDWS